mgnify:CR=1 FL=1
MVDFLKADVQGVEHCGEDGLKGIFIDLRKIRYFYISNNGLMYCKGPLGQRAKMRE